MKFQPVRRSTDSRYSRSQAALNSRSGTTGAVSGRRSRPVSAPAARCRVKQRRGELVGRSSGRRRRRRAARPGCAARARCPASGSGRAARSPPASTWLRRMRCRARSGRGNGRRAARTSSRRSAQRRHLDRQVGEPEVEVLAEASRAATAASRSRLRGRRARARRPRGRASRRCAAPGRPRARAAGAPAAPSSMSPISSRNSVPPSASSKRPGLAVLASVKAPRAWPNSSSSTRWARDRGAVDLDERAVAPRGCRRWRASATSSLPVPLSPRISTRAVGGRDAFDRLAQALDRRRAAEDLRLGGEARLQRRHPALQRRVLEGVADRLQSRSRENGFSMKSCDAEPQRLDRLADRGLAGDDDRRRQRARAARRRTSSTPLCPRQAHVEQQQVGRRLAAGRRGAAAPPRREPTASGAQPLGAELEEEAGADLLVVLDDQDARGPGRGHGGGSRREERRQPEDRARRRGGDELQVAAMVEQDLARDGEAEPHALADRRASWCRARRAARAPPPARRGRRRRRRRARRPQGPRWRRA